MATYIQNKKVTFNYEILDKYEAGIELFGFEVKSIKNKRGDLEGSHITIRGGEAFLIGVNIPPFQPTNTPKNYEATRNRRLLLKKKELVKLSEIENKRGLTIAPISMYSKGNKVKVGIVVVRGKKKFDKRETIKKKDVQRDIDREIKKSF